MQSGNQVTYETTVPGLSWGRVFLVFAALAVVGLLAAVVLGWQGKLVFLGLASMGILFGLNTVTYEYPVAGTTAPTASQSSRKNEISAVITGDNSATDFTVTHNWGLSAAELADGWPRVNIEYLLAAGYTAASLITSKTANTVVFSNTAFTGAALRVRLERPHTIVR